MEGVSEPHCSEEERKELCRIFRRDPRGSEFMVNLAWVACRSYRRDTVLRPFPGRYLDSRGEKDHAALVSDTGAQQCHAHSVPTQLYTGCLVDHEHLLQLFLVRLS